MRPVRLLHRVDLQLLKALALPEVKSALTSQGMEIAPSTPQEMAALMKRDSKRWADVVKQAGIKAE